MRVTNQILKSKNNFKMSTISDQTEKLALSKTVVSGELAVDECRCIRFTGGDKWYPNGCKIHPNG